MAEDLQQYWMDRHVSDLFSVRRPFRPALALAAHVKGTTEYARNLRRNIIRYLILTQALVFRDISTPVKKRLPTIKHLIPAGSPPSGEGTKGILGFVSEEELLTYDSLVTPNTKYYLPIQWALALLGEAKDSGLVTSDMAMVDVAQKVRMPSILFR